MMMSMFVQWQKEFSASGKFETVCFIYYFLCLLQKVEAFSWKGNFGYKIGAICVSARSLAGLGEGGPGSLEVLEGMRYTEDILRSPTGSKFTLRGLFRKCILMEVLNTAPCPCQLTLDSEFPFPPPCANPACFCFQ